MNSDKTTQCVLAYQCSQNQQTAREAQEVSPGTTRYGGAKRDRTADLYNAIVALYQLSYDPSLCERHIRAIVWMRQ